VALDDRYANKFSPLNSTSIYHKPGYKLLYTPMTDEMKCPTNIPLPCVFYSISFDVDATHALTLINKWYDPLNIITWLYWFIDLDLTCFSPLPQSIGAKSSTCPSLLQPVYQAKSFLDLLHFSHMTPCHVSYAMSSFITCVSLATSHFHLHGMCCSHKCSCRLITCVFHLNTY
jgi:hypothetical protein